MEEFNLEGINVYQSNDETAYDRRTARLLDINPGDQIQS